ncbi:hypothetical protein V1512DRAFT_244911 [Lipomyces arxii]|uniref:uncharacterized protein n=1 Tax=Lipomyces arxii TaxID=56418 RepID=UPI0034CF71B2
MTSEVRKPFLKKQTVVLLKDETQQDQCSLDFNVIGAVQLVKFLSFESKPPNYIQALVSDKADVVTVIFSPTAVSAFSKEFQRRLTERTKGCIIRITSAALILLPSTCINPQGHVPFDLTEYKTIPTDFKGLLPVLYIKKFVYLGADGTNLLGNPQLMRKSQKVLALINQKLPTLIQRSQTEHPLLTPTDQSSNEVTEPIRIKTPRIVLPVPDSSNISNNEEQASRSIELSDFNTQLPNQKMDKIEAMCLGVWTKAERAVADAVDGPSQDHSSGVLQEHITENHNEVSRVKSPVAGLNALQTAENSSLQTVDNTTEDDLFLICPSSGKQTNFLPWLRDAIVQRPVVKPSDDDLHHLDYDGPESSFDSLSNSQKLKLLKIAVGATESMFSGTAPAVETNDVEGVTTEVSDEIQIPATLQSGSQGESLEIAIIARTNNDESEVIGSSSPELITETVELIEDDVRGTSPSHKIQEELSSQQVSNDSLPEFMTQIEYDIESSARTESEVFGTNRPDMTLDDEDRRTPFEFLTDLEMNSSPAGMRELNSVLNSPEINASHDSWISGGHNLSNQIVVPASPDSHSSIGSIQSQLNGDSHEEMVDADSGQPVDMIENEQDANDSLADDSTKRRATILGNLGILFPAKKARQRNTKRVRLIPAYPKVDVNKLESFEEMMTKDRIQFFKNLEKEHEYQSLSPESSN